MTRFSLIFGALLTVFCDPALSANLRTLVDNGPSSNRVDVVFLGDGYTEADLATGLYDQHINNYLDYWQTNPLLSDPFATYQNYFNIHAIDIASNESGTDLPRENIFRDTALDSAYGLVGGPARRITVDVGKTEAIKEAAMANAGFTAEMQYVTVNSTRYGGSGGRYAVFAGGNSQAAELALHEVGHSFSNLADEYAVFSSPYLGGEPSEVNVTTDTQGTKWQRWQGYDQPGIGLIDVYEGGRYYEQGIYRPSLNSKMRALNQPFDAISREKIILDIYDFVSPLDAWSDNTATLVDPDNLFADVVDNSLVALEWFVDGAVVPLATGDTFNLRDFGYGAGDYQVSLRAFDRNGFDLVNGWVRTDQTKLEQFISWDVSLTKAVNPFIPELPTETTTSIPEPSTVAALGMMLLGLGLRRRD